MRLSHKILLFASFILLSLLTRGVFLREEVLDIDESAHAIGSWVLMDGKLLYKDFVDNKPPLLYVYYALAQFLFGRGLIAVRLFTVLFTIPLTAYAVSAFFDHSRRGKIAALLFLLFSAAFLAHDMHSTNAELLMILPGTWALVLVRDEKRACTVLRIATAGFLLGVAVLLKYQIATWLAAIALDASRSSISFRKRFFLMIAMIAGFLIPLLLTCIWFDLKGASAELIFWTIINNLSYSVNPISAREAIGRAASYFLPFLIVTAPLWWFSWRSRPMHESSYRALLIVLLIVFSIPPVFIGFRFYPHYFIQLYVPLCLGAAPYASQLLHQPLSRMAKLFCASVIFVLVGFTIANSILYSRKDVYQETDPVFRKTASYLLRDPCAENATLFVWGYAPLFYYYSEMNPASRFAVLSQSGLTTYISGNQAGTLGMIQKKHWDLLMQDLTETPATYIIDTAPAGIYRWDRYPIRNYPSLQRLLQKNYHQLANIEGVVLFRNKNCHKSNLRLK